MASEVVFIEFVVTRALHTATFLHAATTFLSLLEIRDLQNLAKLGNGCTTKLIDGGRERIEFRFNWRCGWVATMVPNCELRSTFWFPVVSM